MTAGIAVGLAATELGFRVSDLGGALQAGGSRAGSGLWIMTAAWVVGAAGAVLLVVAARSRSSRGGSAVGGEAGRVDTSELRVGLPASRSLVWPRRRSIYRRGTTTSSPPRRQD